MSCRLSILVVLAAVVLARPAAADPATGTGLLPLNRPLPQGFSSFFQRPASGSSSLDAPYGATRVAVGAGAPAPARPFQNGVGAAGAPSALCRAAINAAEQRHGIPAGLLLAIGVVESGRRDAATGARLPWPWTINAEGEGRHFDSKEEAVAWVRAAQSDGTRSIDTGCMQVNLRHHPDAFASLEQAFDPASNADYAARFLKALRDGPAAGDWMRAVGYYHSQTPDLAEPYRQQVQDVLAGRTSPTGSPAEVAAVPSPGLPIASLPLAGTGGFGRTLRQAEAPGMARSGATGRSLDAYRAAPILLAARAAPMLLNLRRY